MARHEALRTTFSQIDGRPVQVIGPAESGVSSWRSTTCVHEAERAG